ncbi:MAG: NAD(P)-dependent alcohol dehydrogenase [Proteobacteria bacterium]|nr:NAD(P)-dependent alcohol dehydrogenase [Pseudomonadota bacterium]
MTNVIHAYAAREARGTLTPFQYEMAPLGAHDVIIDITHCGVCYSDVAFIDNELGSATYPLVPGHEIIGLVRAVGTAVDHLEVGQRVGVGPYRSACLHCSYCTSGRENLCTSSELTIVGHHGGFASAIQLSASFAFPIPDGLQSTIAAPLLCAGITVFAPLRRHAAPGRHVGVLGIGGLGHLAIQYAHARGCEVTVFSSTPAKEEQARQFGADHFVAVKQAGAMDRAAGSIDFLLSTSYGGLDWSALLNVLRPDGRICVVGSSMEPIGIPAAMLIMKQLAISGSAAGSRSDMQEMLAFSAQRGVRAQVEVMPMEQVNQAVERVRSGAARYRVVLEAPSAGA